MRRQLARKGVVLSKAVSSWSKKARRRLRKNWGQLLDDLVEAMIALLPNYRRRDLLVTTVLVLQGPKLESLSQATSYVMRSPQPERPHPTRSARKAFPRA